MPFAWILEIKDAWNCYWELTWSSILLIPSLGCTCSTIVENVWSLFWPAAPFWWGWVIVTSRGAGGDIRVIQDAYIGHVASPDKWGGVAMCGRGQGARLPRHCFLGLPWDCHLSYDDHHWPPWCSYWCLRFIPRCPRWVSYDPLDEYPLLYYFWTKVWLSIGSAWINPFHYPRYNDSWS